MTYAKFQRTVAASVAASILSGCAGFSEVRDQVAMASKVATEGQQAIASAPKAEPDNIRQRPRITGDEVRRDRNVLPKRFSESFNYRTQGGQTLTQVAQNLASELGMQVRVLLVSGASQQPVGGNAVGNGSSMVLDWRDKPLKGLFDQIAQQQGIFWRYTADRGVEFFELESRTFHLNVPSGVKKVDSSISLANSAGGSSSSAGGAASGGGGSGGNSVNISSYIEVDPYQSLMASIGAMIEAEEGVSQKSSGAGAASGGAKAAGGAAGGGGAAQASSRIGAGGRVVASPDMGIITVAARPPTLERVAAYVESVNKRYAQNVQIDIAMYSVKLSRQNQAGVSADVLYKSLANHGLNIIGPQELSSSAGVPGRMIVEAGSGRFQGSKLVASALAGMGDVSLVTTGHAIAINGQPSPIQAADQIFYLASSTTTTAPNVGSSTTLQPGSVTVGFTGNFLPLVLSDNRILLQYQLQLSNATLSTVTSGNASIQTPLVSQQVLQQQAYVRDGQSIVLMSFDQQRGADKRQGGIAGFSATADSERNLLVVVMTVSTKSSGAARV